MKAAIVTFWRRFNDENLLFSFHGRATRREYLFFFAAGIATIVFTSAGGSNGFSYLLAFFGFGIILAASVRRLHDSSRDGWSLFLALIPDAGPAIYVFHMISSGYEGINQYGPNPRFEPEFY